MQKLEMWPLIGDRASWDQRQYECGAVLSTGVHFRARPYLGCQTQLAMDREPLGGDDLEIEKSDRRAHQVLTRHHGGVRSKSFDNRCGLRTVRSGPLEAAAIPDQ